MNNRIYKSVRWQHGFTIVELLIVIVVIGILAAITIVSYNGIQARAFDAQQATEVNSIAKALSMYTSDGNPWPENPPELRFRLADYSLIDIPEEVLEKVQTEYPMNLGGGYVEYGYEPCGVNPTGAKLKYAKESGGQTVEVVVGSGC